jgi:hypothetical protein
LGAFAKALSALVGVDNSCGIFHSSPRWGRCRGHQIHLALLVENLLCSFAGIHTIETSVDLASFLEASFCRASSHFLHRLRVVRCLVMCVCVCSWCTLFCKLLDALGSCCVSFFCFWSCFSFFSVLQRFFRSCVLVTLFFLMKYMLCPFFKNPSSDILQHTAQCSTFISE